MSTIPEGSIVITPTEVYNEVKALTIAVRELVASDKAEADDRTALRQRVDQIDNRLTAVERKLLLATGFAAACGAGAGSWLSTLLG